jgi:thiosulfate sulfurtransferase
MSHITAAELALWQAHGFAFDLLDVRRSQARTADPSAIAGAAWHDPAAWLDWKDHWLAVTHPVALYCAHGHEISQGLCAALRAMGIDARSLAGGLSGWKAEGRAVVPVVGHGALP